MRKVVHRRHKWISTRASFCPHNTVSPNRPTSKRKRSTNHFTSIHSKRFRRLSKSTIRFCDTRTSTTLNRRFWNCRWIPKTTTSSSYYPIWRTISMRWWTPCAMITRSIYDNSGVDCDRIGSKRSCRNSINRETLFWLAIWWRYLISHADLI